MRKVLGASVRSIIVLLSKEFSLLVGIAFVLAAPVAYLAMESWLQTFAYSTTIGVDLILYAGLVAFAIALLTVSLLTVRAALANPVDSLRYE